MQLTVDSQALRDSGARIAEVARDIESRVDGSVRSLDRAERAVGDDSLEKTLRELRTTMSRSHRQVAAALIEFGEQVQRAAAAYEETDARLAEAARI